MWFFFLVILSSPSDTESVGWWRRGKVLNPAGTQPSRCGLILSLWREAPVPGRALAEPRGSGRHRGAGVAEGSQGQQSGAGQQRGDGAGCLWRRLRGFPLGNLERISCTPLPFCVYKKKNSDYLRTSAEISCLRNRKQCLTSIRNQRLSKQFPNLLLNMTFPIKLYHKKHYVLPTNQMSIKIVST